jgi:hypothetical protein
MMLKSRIFLPKRISDAIEAANERCRELGYYIVNKSDAVRLIIKHPHLFGIEDVKDCIEAAVVHNSTRPIYVGLNMIAEQNEGVVLSAYIPRDAMNFARDVNAAINSRVGIRAWHIALHLFRIVMEKKTDQEIADAFLFLAKRQTEAIAKIA